MTALPSRSAGALPVALRLLVPLAATLAAAGCGRDAAGPGTSTAPQLLISPASMELYLGQPFTFDVLLDTPEESKSVLGLEGFTVEATPAGALDVTTAGEGVARVAGQARVIAQYGGYTAEASVTVRDAALQIIEVVPATPVLSVGQTLQLTVTGVLSDGSRIDLSRASSGTTYSLSPTSVATIGPNGALTGVAEGQANLQVSNGDISTVVRVEVRPGTPTYVAIEIVPDPIVVPIREAQLFQVLGVKSDGSRDDLLAQGEAVTFTLDDANLASISGSRLQAGSRAGSTVLRATYGQLTAQAQVRVVDEAVTLVSLLAAPDFLRLGVGERAQLRVTGFYSDGSQRDLTSAASGTTYFADTPQVAQPDGNGGVLAVGPGPCQVIIENSGLQAFVFVDVLGEPRELVALEVFPTDAMLAVGQNLQLQVLAFYSDGSVDDVTFRNSGVRYFPPRNGVISVTPDGLVTGNQLGEAALLVQYQFLEARVQIQVSEVNNPILRLDVRPSRIRLEVGQPFFGLDVVATFADGTERSVLGEVGLQIIIDNPMVADWDGVAVFGLSTGTTSLRAIYRGLLASAQIQVSDPTVVLLGIQLNAPPQLQVGLREPLGVFAFFSDGSIVDITNDPQLTLTSDNPSVASINGTLVQGVSAGTALLAAFYQGAQSTARITVVGTTDPITSIRFQPASLTLDVGQRATVRIIGTRASGAQVNLTADPQLSLTPAGPVGIALIGADLEVVGTAQGNGRVAASYLGLTASLPVTVQSTTPTIVQIQILAPGQLARGTTGMYLVVALFSDGNATDITNDPQLVMSAQPPIVSFTPGLILAQQVGTTQITASYQGLTSTVSLTVTATSDTVVGLTFQPSSLSLNVNQRATVQLIATFASGATADVTFDPLVNYSISGPILPSPSPGGIDILAQAAGTAQIGASYRGQSTTLNIVITGGGATVTRLFLIAPANLDLGSDSDYQVVAEFSDGTSLDVTLDPLTQVFVEDPSIFSAAGGVLTPIQVGTTRLGVTYQGFSAQRSINVVNNNPFTSIRFQPASLTLNVGQSGQVEVIARRNNGATENVTALTSFNPSGPINLGPAGTSLSVLAVGPGQGRVGADFNGLTATLLVRITGSVAPVITTLTPDAVARGSASRVIQVDGTGFGAGDEVVVDGVPVPTVVVSATQLRATFNSALFAQVADLQVMVVGPRGPSNTVTLPVGIPPSITSYAPNTVVAGSFIDVVAVGAGLNNLSISAPGLTAQVLTSALDGTSARFRVTAAANTAAGQRMVTVSNPFGSTTIAITVTAATGHMDLVVASGQTLQLSGTNVYGNVTVNTGGRIVGAGTAPLAIIATGDITLRGSIDVSGASGVDGLSDAGNGGAAGPGGGGGGGGGDGNDATPAVGGAGSLAGDPARRPRAWAPSAVTAATGPAAGRRRQPVWPRRRRRRPRWRGRRGRRRPRHRHRRRGRPARGREPLQRGHRRGGGSTCGTNGGAAAVGGGALIRQVALGGTQRVEGRIDANGGPGGDGFNGTGGGGGGSGGLVELTAPGGTIILDDTLSARGGAGGGADFGDGGGGGSGGVVLLDASPGGTITTTLGVIDVTGGAGGAPPGGGFAGRGGAAGLSNVSP
ncbi:MAG: Ig-like domain-containing protein [Deltaproteobacteria bacterium]|nr:Ig-like domain-containing protein [Deltaproteobacteria bacterium]